MGEPPHIAGINSHKCLSRYHLFTQKRKEKQQPHSQQKEKGRRQRHNISTTAEDTPEEKEQEYTQQAEMLIPQCVASCDNLARERKKK